MTLDASDTLALARNLVARGFSVFPVDHPDETTQTDPNKIGKVPIGAWKGYQETRPTDDHLSRVFGNGHRRNVGIPTGALSNVVVVDGDSSEGLAWMSAHLPPTPMRMKTAKGEHWYYRHPGIVVRNKARIKTGDLAVKVDVRGDGGYVVGPYSKHVSGIIYEPVGAWPPTSELPVFDPAWLDTETRTDDTVTEPTTQTPEPSDRQDVLRRTRAYLEATPPAIEGDGGDTHTFQVVCRIIRGFDLTEADALEVLRPWNARCVPPWSEADLRDKILGARKYGTEPIGGLAHLILNPNDPMPSAREFVAREHTIDDTLTLRHQSHVFLAYEHDAGAYIEQDEASIRARLYRFLELTKRRTDDKKIAPFQPTRSKVENVIDALRAVTNLPAAMAPPVYLKNDPGFDPLEMLPFPNGLLHIPTRTLHQPTPDFFTLNAIDFPYDPWAPRPLRWFAFLKSLWSDDDESIETVQEIFGYLLTPDTRFQKIFLEVGPPRSGKGIKGRILRRLVGERNTCSPTLAAFGRDFGKHVLIGKTVAIISDARIGGRTDTASVAETLLSISGEDAQTVERKFLPDWNGKLSTRFLLLTNELPRITDVSGALAKRFIVLALQQSFYGKEDLALYDRLVPELPGILIWALEGRDRLYARGHFQQPKSAQQLIQEFVDLGSPEATFLRQRTQIEPGVTVAQRDLFEAWKTWCAENGRDKPGTAQTFGRNVRAAYQWITTRQLGGRGEQERHWEGLRLIEVAKKGKAGM